MQEKEKLLAMSNFSFSTVFSTHLENFLLFFFFFLIKFEIFVWKLFQFGRA